MQLLLHAQAACLMPRLACSTAHKQLSDCQAGGEGM